MDDRLTEQQQIETLKKLWKEYGVAIVLGAILAIGISLSWRFYVNYKAQKASEASVIYERIMSDMAGNDFQDVATQSEILLKHYASTPYASLSALALAKIAVDQNQLDQAIPHLQWVVKRGSSKTFQQLASLRLARIYIAQNKSQDALKLLNAISDSVFLGLVDQGRANAYVQLNQLDQAKKFYQQALANLPPSASTRALVQMQLNSLPR